MRREASQMHRFLLGERRASSDEIDLHGYALQAQIAPRQDGKVCIHRDPNRTFRIGDA
jgi:hypothetical protein